MDELVEPIGDLVEEPSLEPSTFDPAAARLLTSDVLAPVPTAPLPPPVPPSPPSPLTVPDPPPIIILLALPPLIITKGVGFAVGSSAVPIPTALFDCRPAVLPAQP